MGVEKGKSGHDYVQITLTGHALNKISENVDIVRQGIGPTLQHVREVATFLVEAGTALGRELIDRGHEVVLFQVAHFEPLVRSAGLEFHRIGDREFPLGSLRPLDQTLGRL